MYYNFECCRFAAAADDDAAGADAGADACGWSWEGKPLNVQHASTVSRAVRSVFTGAALSAYPNAIAHHTTWSAGMSNSSYTVLPRLPHASCKQVANPNSSASRHIDCRRHPTCPQPFLSTALSHVTMIATGACMDVPRARTTSDERKREREMAKGEEEWIGAACLRQRTPSSSPWLPSCLLHPFVPHLVARTWRMQPSSAAAGTLPGLCCWVGTPSIQERSVPWTMP
jgi:hypothetical protein